MNRETADQALDETLKELIMQARRNDQTAYRSFLMQVAPVIRRTVAARAGRWNRQNYIEDITQDTLLAVHLKLHVYDIAQPFLPWLRTVARYKLIDFMRRNDKAFIYSLDDETTPEPIADPEEMTATFDLDKLLTQLKPPAGEIIRALKIEGYSVRDLAAQHRMSEANIKITVHRGLQKLAALIRDEKMVAP